MARKKTSRAAKDLISMHGSKSAAARAAGVSPKTLDNALKGKAKSDSLEKIARTVHKEQEQLKKNAIYLTAALGAEQAAKELGVSESTLRRIRKGQGGGTKTAAAAKAKKLLPTVKANPTAQARVKQTISKKAQGIKRRIEKQAKESERESEYYFEQILKLPYGKEAGRVMAMVGAAVPIATKNQFPFFTSQNIGPNERIGNKLHDTYLVVVFKNYNYFKKDIGDQVVMLSPFALTLYITDDDTPNTISDKIMSMFGPGGTNHKPDMVEILGFFFSDEPPGRKKEK